MNEKVMTENTLSIGLSLPDGIMNPTPACFMIFKAHVVGFIRNSGNKGTIMLIIDVCNQTMCAPFVIKEMCLADYMNTWLINPMFGFPDMTDFQESVGYVICVPHVPVPIEFVRFISNHKIAATTISSPITVIRELTRVFKTLDENNRHTEMKLRPFKDIYTLRTYLFTNSIVHYQKNGIKTN